MIAIPVVQVGILRPDGTQAPFTLNFYGVSASEAVSPTGGLHIREALRRRGLAGYHSNPVVVVLQRSFHDAAPDLKKILRSDLSTTPFHGLHAMMSTRGGQEFARRGERRLITVGTEP